MATAIGLRFALRGSSSPHGPTERSDAGLAAAGGMGPKATAWPAVRCNLE